MKIKASKRFKKLLETLKDIKVETIEEAIKMLKETAQQNLTNQSMFLFI